MEKESNRKYGEARGVCTGWGGRKQAKVSNYLYVCVCFSDQKVPSTRLCWGFNCLELQLHSKNLETRGVCVYVSVLYLTSSELWITCPGLPNSLPPQYVCLCVHYISCSRVCFHCAVLGSSYFHYIRQHCAFTSCLHLIFHVWGILVLSLQTSVTLHKLCNSPSDHVCVGFPLSYWLDAMTV